MKLFTALPTSLTGDRLEKFINARDFLAAVAAPCLSAAAATTTCTCNFTIAQACAEDALQLLDNSTSPCSEIQAAVTCLRTNSNCTGTEQVFVDAALTKVTDKLNISRCYNLDPGSDICLGSASCATDIRDVCTDPICSDSFLRCVESQTGCGSYQRLFNALQLRSLRCSTNLTDTLAIYRGSSYQHTDLETCLSAVEKSRRTNMDDLCNDITDLKACLDGSDLDPASHFLVEAMKATSQSFIDSVCSADNRPNVSDCSPSDNHAGCIQDILTRMLVVDWPGTGNTICSEKRGFDDASICLAGVSCGDEDNNRRLASVRSSLHQTYRNVCSIATTEQVNKGCNVARATECISTLATRIYGGDDHVCGAVSSARDCVRTQASQCPEAIKMKLHTVLMKLTKLTAKDCCLKGQSKTCDPAGAVTCIMDIHHWAKMPAPDWEGICEKVDSSLECMRGFTDTCEQCEKDTVHYIVERLNRDIVDTCRRPPEGKCKVTKALTCVETLKTFAALQDSSENWDFTCLKVQQAETCISEYMEECVSDVKFTVDYELSKVVRLMEAESCRKVDTTQNCVDIFRQRIQDIINYDPRNASNTRCLIPGMKAHGDMELEECRPSIMCASGSVARPQAALVEEDTVFGFTNWTCVPKCSDGATLKLVGGKKGSSGSSQKDSKKSWQCVDDKDSKESGKNSKESGKNSKESGKNSKESGKNSKESGKNSKESGKNSKESGQNSKESGKNSKESGQNSKESGKNSKESGKNSKESGNNSKESGKNSKESGKNSKESGKNSKESGKNSKESGKNSKESGKNSKESGKNSKESGKNSKETGKNSKESGKNSKESGKKSQSMKKVLYKTRLEKLCAEARVAWSCVEHELKDKADSRSTILFQTVSGLWEIALKMCDEPKAAARCYTCDNALTNDACNLNMEECNSTQSVCMTRVKHDESRTITSLSKGCMAEDRCKPGCVDGICTYCCSGQLCNARAEGPISPVCSVSYAAKCAFRLATSLSANKEIQCSVFEAELKCMKEVRQQCVSDTQSKLFQLTEVLYQSVSFKKCQVLLAPPTCSIHSVVSLGLLLSAPEARKEDVCRNFDATMLAVTHAKKTSGCSADAIERVDGSMTLIRTQLRGYGCQGVDGYHLNCDKEKECSIKKATECFKGVGPLVATQKWTDKKEVCRKYLEIRSCLENSRDGCTERVPMTLANNLWKQFESATEIVADRCEAEVKAASCDPDDHEVKCRPMAALTKCFNNFRIRSVFSECQNLKLAHTCIMRETANCLPIQRKLAMTLLYLQPDMPAVMARCGKMPDTDDKITPYTQVMSCMGEFAMSLKTVLMSPSESLSAVCTKTIDVVQRCVSRLNLDRQARLSPLEKLYLRNTLMTLQYFEDAVCEDVEPKSALNVSDICLSGYERASTCLSVQTIGLMTRPFLPATDVASFCGHFYEIETCVETSLESCATEERGAVGQYLEVVREKSISVCMSQIRTRPKCSLRVAGACLSSLSAYMESGNITLSDQCMMVETVLACVKSHMFGCEENTTQHIKHSLKIVIAKYGSACPAQVRPLICHDAENSTCGLTDAAAMATCIAPLASLAVQSNQYYEIQSCWALDQVYRCVRKLSGDCSDTELTTAWSTIQSSVAALSSINLPCAADRTVDSIRSTCPIRAPTCSIMAAMSCLRDAREKYTGSDITSIARDSSSCVWGNVTGCNTLQRTIFSLSITNIFQTSLSLTLQDTTRMPFYDLIINFNSKVTLALTNPTYNHLDLCFAAKATASEFERVFVTAGVDGLGFEKVLVQRGRNMLKKFTSLACNDFDIIDKVLTYEETSYECKKYIYHYSSILVQSIFSGFLSMDDTTALCRAASMMERANHTLVMASCSAGFRQQMQFASRLLTSTVSGVCKKPRVCNLMRARHCVSKLSITVSHYGLNTTQEDVCIALRSTDKCIEYNTFRCMDVMEDSFKARYTLERSVALDICGGVDESAFIPRCKVKSMEYADKCSPRKAERCLRKFVRNVVTWPILRRGRQCSEFTQARHCLLKTAQSCVERGDQLSFNGYLNKMTAFFGERTCNVAEYEQECFEGCEVQEAEECISNLHVQLKSANMLDGSAACVAISDARMCLTSKMSRCPKSLQLRLQGKLDTVLRVANLHNVDCINVYRCISDFEGLAAKIFGFSKNEPEHDSKEGGKSSKESGPSSKESGKNSKESGKNSKESGKNSKESGKNSKESGKNSKESGKNSKESGKNSKESGKESGKNSKESGKNSKESGKESGKNSKESGQNSKESGKNSKESGKNSKESGKNSKESGNNSKESGKNSKESGKNSKESGQNSKESGKNSKESGKNSKESGKNSKESGQNSKESGKNSKESGKNSKESGKNSKESGKNSKETGKSSKEAGKGSHEHSKPDIDLDLSSLCLKAREAWECVKTGLHLVPSKHRHLFKTTLQGIWNIVEHRCANTVRQSCYSCDGALTDEECNTKTMRCGHQEQMCESILKRDSDNKLRFYKSCVRPSFCTMTCKGKGDDCRSFCCVGDLCNKKYNVESPVEPLTCRVDRSVSCALSLVRNIVNYGEVKCSSSRRDLECMGKNTRECRTPTFVSLSTTAFSVLSSIAESTCLVEVTSSSCGSKAILSTYAILKSGFATLDNKICRGVNETIQSLQRIEDKGVCTLSELIPVRQSLNLIKHQTAGFCGRAPTSVTSCQRTSREVSGSRTGKCGGQFLSTAYCVAQAIRKFNSDGATFCSAFRSTASCLDPLKHCAVPASLRTMNNTLSSLVKAICTSPAGTSDTACPAEVCHLAAARACYATTVVTNVTSGGSICENLRVSRGCVSSQTSGCFSIQEVTVVQDYKATVTRLGAGCQLEELTVKQDIFTDLSTCLVTYSNDLTAAFTSSDMLGEMCAAHAASKTCTNSTSLPLLSSNFTKSAVKTFNMGFGAYLEDKCRSDSSQPAARRRRQTNPPNACNLQLAQECANSYLLASWTLPTTELSDRSGTCRELEAKYQCVTENVDNCASKAIILSMMSSAKSTFDEFCYSRQYKEDGCDNEMVTMSLEGMNQLTTSALVSTEDVCSNTKNALGWLKKFSSGCPDATILPSYTAYFGGIVGNSCPRLTVELFCGDSAPINRSCDFKRAETCVSNIDLSIDAEADTENFCSGLLQNVTCTRNNLDGCLSSQIAKVSVEAAVNRDTILAKSCNIDADLLEFGDVCTARPVCSLSGAYRCLEDLLIQNYDSNDCTIRTAKKNCMATHLQGCNHIQISLATALYEVLLPTTSTCTAVVLATSPFSTSLSTSQQQEVTCMTDMLTSLDKFTSASTLAPRHHLCQIFRTYSLCRVGGKDLTIDVVEEFISANCSDVVACAAAESYCSNGSCFSTTATCDGTSDCADRSDEEDCGVAIDSACQIREASFCVMKQLSSAIMGKFLPVEDKKDMCGQRVKASQCIQARTNTCPSMVKAVFEQTLAVSEALIVSQGSCDKPKMCIEEHTFTCINKLAVVVAQTDITTGTKDILCKQFLETKSCVEQFSATCTGGALSRITSQYNSILALVDGKCDDYTEPTDEPETLCPDIAPADRKCEVFTAFNCLLGSYTNLINYNPRNNLENSKSCFALQSTIRCVAANISGCKEEDAAEIVKSLNNLRDGAKERCMLYDTSLCGNPQPCPVGGAGCVKTFKQELSSHPEKDVCELITTARTCISDNTVDCSPQSWAIADYNLKNAIKEMKTQVRCDSNSADSCILTFQTQAHRILTRHETTAPTMSLADQCSAVEITRMCINDKLVSTPMGGGMDAIVNRLWRHLNASVVAVCEGAIPTCPLGDRVGILLNLLVKLVTTPAYTQQAFCSEVAVMLSRVSTAGLDSCGVNDTLSSLVLYLQESYTAKCQTTVTCQQATTDGNTCLGGLTASTTCPELQQVQACLGKAIGQCPTSSTALMATFTTNLAKMTTACERFPVITHSLSPDNTIYLAEGGPSVKLTLQDLDFTAAFGASGGEIRLKIQFDIDASTVPRCPDDVEIQQVVSDKCQIVIDDSNNDEKSFEISPVLDNRIDGYRQLTATVTMEKWAGATPSLTATQTLATFNIMVQDRDVKSAICSSINDPHFNTFDGRMFNYMGLGTFLMYETSSPIKLQVQTKFQICGNGGSCNCAVRIRVDNDVIEFDSCSTSSGFTPLNVNIKKSGDFTKAVKILKSADSKTYQVVIATGQIVKVRSSDGLLNTWILASANDRGNTRGLCGSFDGDRYNDLTLPDGSLYEVAEGDMTYGTLTPNNYTWQWRVVAGSEDDISSGVQGNVSDTILPTTCSSCGATAACDMFARSQTCGLIRTGAVDITSQVVAMNLQAEPINSKRRKRQATTEPETLVDTPQPGWPTSTGWTEQNATEFCEQKIRDAQLNQKCSQAAEVTNNTADIDQNIKNCVDDIRMTGTTAFAEETNEDLKETCISGIEKDPIFQTDTRAKEIAAEIMNLACTPIDCNGNGRCDGGICLCNSGYLGADCSVNKLHLQPPILHGLEHFGLCQFSDTQACNDIFVSGRNFVESELLRCHIEIVEINENGFTRVPGNMAVMTSAVLVTETTVRCSVSTIKGSNYAALVAISNDGVTSSQKEVFIAYDPTCQECDHVARKCYHQDNTCNIGRQCYTADTIANNNTCVSCQPAVSKTEWTTVDGLVCKVKESIKSRSSTLGLSATIGIGVACAVILFIVLAVIVRLVCMRRSRMEQKRLDRESYPQRPEMYMNPAYQGSEDRLVHLSSFEGEPQDSFRGRNVHPRVNTTGHDSFPDMH
ncbi:uncharacterized protein LOC124139581 [Haliotis rufescens]|uniref:uncharacterized protein LOC124139581 n=1 Tax=Haliotis rufescens TaxID=6454 RepID=UPI00201EBCC0|nr:uncharacterized protein LOC124139581 [Haliotis rufescens]